MSLCHFIPTDIWEVHHKLHIQLQAGSGVTYSMDSSSWPMQVAAPLLTSPITTLGFENVAANLSYRHIVQVADLVFSYPDPEVDNELAGYVIEERIDVPGVLLDQVWSLEAFQAEQAHEIRQTTVFIHDNEAHRVNGPVEMPSELFIQAVTLAVQIPFDQDSDFERSVHSIPGGHEQHPALEKLCTWWESVRPAGEPFKPGSAMPLVRVQDDGQYWWGHHEVPKVPVVDFNTSGKDMARIGDFLLVVFQAKQESATFENGMKVMSPSGQPSSTVGISEAEYLNGEWDEAWFCLCALASFPNRFPAAWNALKSSRPKKRRAAK